MINGLIRKPVNKELLKVNKAIYEDKQYLAATDYKAIKYAEGLISEEEYEETRLARQAARDRINTNEDLLVSIHSNRNN